MPRRHRRKTTRWINEEYMESAVADIVNGVETPSTAARKYGLKRTTIIYRVERKQKMEKVRGKGPVTKYSAPPLLSEIFSDKQEKELMDFLNRYTYLPYDTSSSYKAARQLVYQFVKTHEIKHPKMWDIEQQAGIDWLMGFIQRNPQTNLRKPSTESGPKSEEDDDEDEDDLSDSVKKLPYIIQNDKTEIGPPTLADLPIVPKSNGIPMSEQSFESDMSNAYSFSHTSKNDSLRPQDPLNPGVEEENEIEFDIGPECDMIIPNLNIKQESDKAADVETKVLESIDSKAEIPKLEMIPTDDDVFNSFGRNIAFQARELYRLSKLDAFELMREVQATVSNRLTTKLRLMHERVNSKRKSRMLLPRVIKIDDDDHL